MSQIEKDDLLKELIAARYNLPSEAVQLEMLDFFRIVAMGAKKYAMNNWLEPNGIKSDERAMHDSMFHHLSESYVGGSESYDHESGEDPLLHLTCRGMMAYTRRKRGILHEKAIIGEVKCPHN